MNFRTCVVGVALALSFAVVGCSNEESDARKAGFENVKEMADIRAAGYSTKQKYLEMRQLAETRKARPALPTEASAPGTGSTTPNAAVTPQVEAAPAAAPQAMTPKVATPESVAPKATAGPIDLEKCIDPASCVTVMLSAAAAENLGVAMDAARRIDGLPKPARGDRKTARKLNQDGLDALRERKMPEAIALFTKARDADQTDEEVIGNLIYAYVEDGNFVKASTLTLDGLLINPRRANLWLPYAVAQQKQGKGNVGLAAVWLAWQFSTDKEKMLNYLDTRIEKEDSESMKLFYTSGKAWVKDNKKPQF